jgi:hypothetical protein
MASLPACSSAPRSGLCRSFNICANLDGSSSARSGLH